MVETYRNVIDEMTSTGQPLSSQRLMVYQQELKKAENRPSASGFYHGLPDHSTLLYGVNGAGVTYDFVGVVKTIDDHGFTMELRNVVEKGDTLECFRPAHNGLLTMVETMHDENGMPVSRAFRPMSLIHIDSMVKPQINDMVRKVDGL